MIIFNKYNLLECLTNGSYGCIYKGENIRTKEKVAIKIEQKNDTGLGLLKRETQIYLYLESIVGFPQLKWYGSDNTNNYLVMTLLGESLTNIKTKYGALSVTLVRNIGQQMMQRIQVLHSKNLIHRDIKPANFLFGLNNNNQLLYLIDFGFCKKYKTQNGEHFSNKMTTNIIGTVNFISLNVHKKIEPSRRDDIESIIYILIYLLGLMEWEKYNNNNIESILKIIESKQNIIQVIPEFLKKMLEYTRSLEFDEDPNYELLITLLNE